MKKKIVLLVLLFQTSLAYAKIGISDRLRSFWEDDVAPAFPIIVVVVFVLCVLMNLGLFYGEKRDYREGVNKILIYVGAVMCMKLLVDFLMGLSLV